MARFYGFTDEQLMEMPIDRFVTYRIGMNVLEARENLMNLRISCAPDMKKEDRTKLFNALHKEAYPQEPTAMTHEHLARLLNG